MEEKLLTGFIALFTSLIVSLIAYLYTLKKIRHEKKETFNLNHYERQVEAYLEFWSLLKPFTDFDYFDDTIIKKKEGKKYLNVTNSMSFFKGFRDFFYSKQGIYLSRELRDPIFELRKFIEEKSNDPKEGMVELTNNEYKIIYRYMVRIRIIARTDIGVRDISIPTEELDLINK